MSTKNLYIIKTDTNFKQSFDLINRLVSKNNHIYLYLYKNEYMYDMYYKYLSILKKEFLEDKKYIFYETYSNKKDNILYKLYTDQICKKFNRYIYLNPCYIYYDRFFTDVNSSNLDLEIIKPYQSIDLNLKLNTKTSDRAYVFSYKMLEYFIKNRIDISSIDLNQIPDTYQYQINHKNSFLSVEHRNTEYVNIWEEKFKLLYLVETGSSDLKDSYTFFYTDNSKCMNINNQIVGTFTIDSQDVIKVDWQINNEIITNHYIKSENSNDYRLVKNASSI